MGSLLGSREAIRLMRQQPPHPKPVYHIFNMGFSRYNKSAAAGCIISTCFMLTNQMHICATL